jgi:hypothetical protein
MEKVVELGISASSFLGCFETTKIVDDEILNDTVSYFKALSLNDPFLLVYRQAIEEQERIIGNVCPYYWFLKIRDVIWWLY